jgi:acylphosphatase
MAKHLFIRGRVQGVGYRAAMCDEANRRRVNGWVRNRRDGTVEAFVDGDPESVAALIDWVKLGPPGAKVMDVVAIETDGEDFSGFDWRPTA